MNWFEKHMGLVYLFAQLYLEVDKAKSVAEMAGLNLTNISFQGPAGVIWHNIFSEAIKNDPIGRVHKLMDIALGEYPDNPVLKDWKAKYSWKVEPLATPVSDILTSRNEIAANNLATDLHKNCDRTVAIKALQNLKKPSSCRVKVAFLHGTLNDHPYDLIDRFLQELNSEKIEIFPNKVINAAYAQSVEVTETETDEDSLIEEVKNFLGHGMIDPVTRTEASWETMTKKMLDGENKVIVNLLNVTWGDKSIKVLGSLLDFWKSVELESAIVLVFVCVIHKPPKRRLGLFSFGKSHTAPERLKEAIKGMLKKVLSLSPQELHPETLERPWRFLELKEFDKSEIQKLLQKRHKWPLVSPYLEQYEELPQSITMSQAAGFIKALPK